MKVRLHMALAIEFMDCSSTKRIRFTETHKTAAPSALPKERER